MAMKLLLNEDWALECRTGKQTYLVVTSVDQNNISVVTLLYFVVGLGISNKIPLNKL